VSCRGYRGGSPTAVQAWPALCESCPLVTPYYCRLGDLPCYTCMLYLSTFCVCPCMCILCFLCSLCCFPLQLSPSVLLYCWLGLLTCKNRLPYNLFCVGGDVKHFTIQSKTQQVKAGTNCGDCSLASPHQDRTPGSTSGSISRCYRCQGLSN